MCMTNMVGTINTFAFDATTTTLNSALQENGWIKRILVEVPNFTNAITVTITIKDRRGYVVYTKAAIAKNAIASIGSSIDVAEVGVIPVDLNYTLNVTLSGAAGGTGGTVNVLCYVAK